MCAYKYPEVLSPASDKAKLLTENFSRISNLDDSHISLPAFLSRTSLKLHNIPGPPKLVKKFIIDLDPKTSGRDCIPVVVLKTCEPELPDILAEVFSMSLIGLWLKTAALLVFFLWLEKSLKNL